MSAASSSQRNSCGAQLVNGPVPQQHARRRWLQPKHATKRKSERISNDSFISHLVRRSSSGSVREMQSAAPLRSASVQKKLTMRLLLPRSVTKRGSPKRNARPTPRARRQPATWAPRLRELRQMWHCSLHMARAIQALTLLHSRLAMPCWMELQASALSRPWHLRRCRVPLQPPPVTLAPRSAAGNVTVRGATRSASQSAAHHAAKRAARVRTPQPAPWIAISPIAPSRAHRGRARLRDAQRAPRRAVSRCAGSSAPRRSHAAMSASSQVASGIAVRPRSAPHLSAAWSARVPQPA